jgi:hypothetical protein
LPVKSAFDDCFDAPDTALRDLDSGEHDMAKSFKIQGYSFTGFGQQVYGTQTARHELDLIANGGGNAIAIMPEYYQTDIHANSLAPTIISPTDNDLIDGIHAAQARGIDVLLKPMIDALDQNWRATLDPTDPAAWFASYKSFIVHYAQIAEQTGVKTMSIGCELRSMTGPQYRAQWLDIIAAVRNVYHGDLTYAAEISEASTLSFWDKLDSIGVDGYFPLAVEDKTPTVKELEYAWTHPSANTFLYSELDGRSPVDYLHDLADKYHKHVAFTEIGYRAVDGDAIDPANFGNNGTVNAKLQADLYKAMFNTFASQGGNWFDGFYFWERRAENQTEDTDFHTKGRAAQKVIDTWFGMDDNHHAAPNTGMTLFGTARNDNLTAGVGGETLKGGLGNDQLVGSEGNDVLIGGSAHRSALKQSIISLDAYGDMLKNEGAKFKVLINGHVVGHGEAKAGTEAWDASAFAFTFDTPKSFHSLQISFTNDAAAGAHDRNLYVTAINLNGVDFNLESANNTQSPHTGTLYTDGKFDIDLRAFFDTIVPVRSDNDILDGGFGNDKLTGGYGKDVFGFATGYGKDEITDFGKGDSIYVANWKAMHDFGDIKSHATEHGHDLWISAGKDRLIIDHFDKADLSAGDFQF